MTEWKKVKLGDVAEVKGGKRLPLGSSLVSRKTPHPYIRVRDLNNIRKLELTDNYEYIDEATQKLIKNYIVNTDDIIISIVGTVGLVGIIGKSLNNANLTENCAKLVNLQNINSNFLYYFLSSVQGQAEIKKQTVGAVQQKLPIKNIRDIELFIPPLSTQKKIAGVLSCLDAKIELNRRINENLEQQAQAIFKEWFVDNAKPEWKLGKLCEIADVIMGQSPDGKSYNEEGNGKIFFQGRAEFGDRFPTIRLYTTEPKRIASQNSVLLSVRAPVGDINVALEECCIGRGLASITAKGDYQSFVLYTMKNAKTALDVYNGEGTIFGCVNKDALNNLDVIIPPMEEIMKFEEVAKPIDEKVKANTIESRLLVQIRDTLLPKLMNGEIIL